MKPEGSFHTWATVEQRLIGFEPSVDHARILRSLLGPVGVGGNLVNDAHLAALSIEHRCVIVSYDHDFARFEGVSLGAARHLRAG